MFDWQGLGIVTCISAVGAGLGCFMCLRWWISTGNSVDKGVTKPFLTKMWGGIGLIGPALSLLYQFHVFK